MPSRGLTPSGWVALLVAACLCVLALASTMPPTNFDLAHWIAFVPLLVALRRASLRHAGLAGVFCGVGVNLLVFSWVPAPLTEKVGLSTNAAWWGLLAFSVTLAPPWVVLIASVPFLRRAFPRAWPVAWAAAGVVCEAAFMEVSPLPFAQGVSQHRRLALWQIASATGVVGLSGLLLLTNGVIAELIGREWSFRRKVVCGLGQAVLLGAVTAWGARRAARIGADIDGGASIRMLQIQSHHDMAWRTSHSPGQVFQYWEELTQRVADKVDLVVWPEGSTAYEWTRPAFVDSVQALADTMQADFLVGTGVQGGARKSFNAVMHFVPTPREPPAGLDRATLTEEARSCAPALAGLDALQRAALDPAAVHCPPSPGTGAVPDDAFVRMFSSSDLWDRYAWARARVPADSSTTFTRAREGVWTVQPSDPTRSPLRVVCTDVCRLAPSIQRYDKMIPLPLGERIFAFVGGDERHSLVPGSRVVTFEVGKITVGTPICYEGVFARHCARFEAADLLVNASNDAWFGETRGSELHGILIGARAVEMGVPVVRAVHSGVSFVVDPSGRTTYRTKLFEEVARVVTVPVTSVPTLYRRVGGRAFPTVCALALLTALATRYARRGGQISGESHPG